MKNRKPWRDLTESVSWGPGFMDVLMLRNKKDGSFLPVRISGEYFFYLDSNKHPQIELSDWQWRPLLDCLGDLDDVANHKQIGGDHYKKLAVQPWDALQAWQTPEAFQGFLHGNAVTYLARYRDKGGKVDLEKAIHYLQKLLEVMP